MQQQPNSYPQYPQQQWQQSQQQPNYTQPETYYSPQQQWQQPPIPQQPPQYQPSMIPPKHNSPKRLWLILAAVVLVLAVIIGVASQSQNQQTTQTTQTPQSTQAVQQPTTAPTKQIPKLTSIPVNHAVLGGTEDSFNTTFGTDPNAAGRVRNYTFSVDGQQGTAIALLDDNDSYVRFITVKPVDAGTVWDSRTGQDAVRLFMPSDARHIKDIQDPTIGGEHVYISATLAKTFPASSFADANSGNPVPVGTFYFNCDNGLNQDNATHVGACTIGLGQ
jgi:hypothetical protein